MKQFNLICDDFDVNFNFPTSLAEISIDYLTTIASSVHVANNYTLVGVVYHEKLGNIIITRKQAKKSFNAGVVPIFIKAGNTQDNDFIKSATIKDKIIIATSQLSLAHHVVIPNNVLSLDFFIKHLDKDVTVASRYQNKYGNEPCYFIEFKLVPNCDIVGFYHGDTKLTNECHMYFTSDYISENNIDSSNKEGGEVQA